MGNPAKRQAITNPQKTISSIKRFMGNKYSEVQEEIKRAPYKVVQGPNDTPRVEIDGKLYSHKKFRHDFAKIQKSSRRFFGTRSEERFTVRVTHDATSRPPRSRWK